MSYLVQTVIESVARSSFSPVEVKRQFGPKSTIWVKSTNGIVNFILFTIYRKNLPTLHSFGQYFFLMD
jgi:hypothetical protein